MDMDKGLILIVDDEPFSAEVLHSALSSEYDLLLANNGYDAIRIIKERRPDLVILDVVMPGLNGFDVCRIIKSDNAFADIPVIFLTATDSIESETQGLGLGGIDYLTKPVNLGLLKLRAHNHIELKRRSDLVRQQRDLLIRQKVELEYMARTDLLTGLANRWEMATRLDAEKSRSERHGKIFSMLIADIDHFKRVNDSYGHVAGDRVIQAIADTLGSSIRHEDTCGRWGGEEFLILLPETGLQKAKSVAEKIVETIRTTKTDWEGQSIGVTASMGYGEFTPGMSIDDFVRQVDDALYGAKAAGRDRVATLESWGEKAKQRPAAVNLEQQPS